MKERRKIITAITVVVTGSDSNTVTVVAAVDTADVSPTLSIFIFRPPTNFLSFDIDRGPHFPGRGGRYGVGRPLAIAIDSLQSPRMKIPTSGSTL